MRAAKTRTYSQDRIRSADHLSGSAVHRSRWCTARADYRSCSPSRRSTRTIRRLHRTYRRAAAQFGTVAHPVGMHSPASSPTPASDPRAVQRITSSCGPDWRAARLGANRRRSTTKSSTARCTSAHRHHRPQRSPTPSAASASDADLIYTVGAVPVGARLHAVELYASKVIPMVREILDDQSRDLTRHDARRRIVR